MARGRGNPKKAQNKRYGNRPRRKGALPLDPFGLERETLIAKSGVRRVFTPHQPVSDLDLLFGRQEEVRRLIEALNTPGQHVLLYGERGVGKSSLANVVATAGRHSLRKLLFKKRCDSSDNFKTIMTGPLREVGADLTLVQVTQGDASRSSASIGSGPISIGSDASSEVVATYEASGQLSPSSVAEALSNLDAILLIDEADAIKNTDDRRRLAELIKHLSDDGSLFKVMVVGIAQTGDELTAAHPSVQRCLRETKLRRMTNAELREIVDIGSETLGLKFDPKVVSAIVELSAGYPHFTHLLALKCAEEAIVTGRKTISPEHLEEAMRLAVGDAEGTLRRQYDDAIRSVVPMYRYILMAAARFGGDEIESKGLRDEIEKITNEPISQGSLNNYLQRLVSDDGSTTVMRRLGKGHYRFTDPRMPSFVRIANQMV